MCVHIIIIILAIQAQQNLFTLKKERERERVFLWRGPHLKNVRNKMESRKDFCVSRHGFRDVCCTYLYNNDILLASSYAYINIIIYPYICIIYSYSCICAFVESGRVPLSLLLLLAKKMNECK